MSVRQQKLEYLPARLIEGKRKWYILFYQEQPNAKPNQLKRRFRPTFGLNFIPDLIARKRYASLKIKDINKILEKGTPYVYPKERKVKLPVEQTLKDTNIVDALELAEKIKCNTDRERTIGMVESMCRIFNEFLDIKKWKKMKINDFSKKHAVAFLDYGLFTRNIGPRTYNNYIERMKAILNELVDREYLDVNPFAKMKKKKILGKKRRAFSEQEREIVATHIKKDKWLWLGVQLQFYCFIRPIEQRRMRIHMIDLHEGVIRLPAKVTKNKESAIITIPKGFLKYLREFGLEEFNQRWILFGAGGKPNPTKCCGHNTYNLRHKNLLTKLFKEGKLDDIEGLQFYSWKDTGVVELFKKKVNILEIMRQLRHKDLSTTQKYCQSLYIINYEIQNLVNPILMAA